MKNWFCILFLFFTVMHNGIAQKTSVQICSEQDIASTLRPKYRNQVELFLENYYAGILFNIKDEVIKETYIEQHMMEGTQRYKPEFMLQTSSHNQYLTPKQYLQELDKAIQPPLNKDNLSYEVDNINIDKNFYKKGMASCYLIADYDLSLKNGDKLLFKRRCRAYCLFPSAMAYIHVRLMQVEPVKDIVAYNPQIQFHLMEDKKEDGVQTYEDGWADKTATLLKNYQETGVFLNGMCKVKSNGKWGMIDDEGKVIVPFEYTVINQGPEIVTASKGDWWEIIWPVKLQTSYDHISEEVSEGMVTFRSGGKTGFLKKSGITGIRESFAEAKTFNQGLAAVAKDNLWGFINTSAKVVVPLIYDEVGEFSEGLVAVCKQKKWGYVNTQGDVVIPIKFNSATPFVNGQAVVVSKNKICLIDTKGNIILKNDKYNFKTSYSEGLLCVQDNKDKFHPTDLLGMKAITKGVIMAFRNYGFINEEQNLVIPYNFEYANNFSEGMAVVQDKNKLWGYINTKGEAVIQCQYDKAFDFKEGLAPVVKEGKYGYINKNGDTIIPFIFTQAESFKTGKALVNYNGLKGYINRQGQFVKQ